MEDILGREIKEYDLVVAKGTGTGNKGLRIGVVLENSIRFLKGYGNYSELFLISNPTQEELNYKVKILESMEQEKERQKKKDIGKRGKKAIPSRELKIGQQYITDNNEKVVYLGYGTVEEFSKYIGRYEKYKSEKKEEGYIYATCIRKLEEGLVIYANLRTYEVRKTRKRLISKTDLQFDVKLGEIVVEENRSYSCSGYNYTKKLVFTIQK